MAGGIHANRWREYVREIHRVLRPGGWCQLVEIYFNAQSDNGSLTHSELLRRQRALRRGGRGWGERGRLEELTGMFSADHSLRRWSRRYLESMQPYKDPRAPLHLERLVRNAGFVDVETRLLPLPLSAWSTGRLSVPTLACVCELRPQPRLMGRTDAREHDIGAANRENVRRLLSSLAIYPFTENLGWVRRGPVAPRRRLTAGDSMTIADLQVLVAQARAEADNPAFKVGSPGEDGGRGGGRIMLWMLWMLTGAGSGVRRPIFPCEHDWGPPRRFCKGSMANPMGHRYVCIARKRR